MNNCARWLWNETSDGVSAQFARHRCGVRIRGRLDRAPRVRGRGRVSQSDVRRRSGDAARRGRACRYRPSSSDVTCRVRGLSCPNGSRPVSRASREVAYDTTIRFTHELRMTLRELGSRYVDAELIDVAGELFYLTCDEAVTTPSDARLRIKRRRAERERFQAQRLPDSSRSADLVSQRRLADRSIY